MTRKAIESILERHLEGGQNNARGKEGDSTGIAMENVITRLELYYGRKNLFSIWSDGPGTGTEVTVLLPKEREHVSDSDSR
jgi:LytS/YehU family sensor histidine kinase